MERLWCSVDCWIEGSYEVILDTGCVHKWPSEVEISRVILQVKHLCFVILIKCLQRKRKRMKILAVFLERVKLMSALPKLKYGGNTF